MTKNMKKTDIRPFTRQLYRGSFWSIVLALGDSICAMIMNLMISWLIQQLSDLIAGYDTGFTLVDLIGLSGVTVGICLLMYILAYFGRPTFISRGIAQYKEYVFQRLTEKNISALSKENASVYISALSNDVTAIETNYLSNIFPFVECLLTMLGALVMMFCNNPQLTIVSIALSLLPLAASLLTGGKVAEAEKKVSASNSTYISTLTDCLTGFSVVKSFRAEKQLLRIFKENINKLMQTKRTRRRISLAVNMFASVAQLVAQFGVFIVAAFMAGKDSGITVGTVFIFVQLMNYVLNPIALFPRYIAEIRSSRALIRKLADALDNNVPKASATASAELESGIELRDITFGYEENKPVLKGISFTFEAGKSYAVVGASGSGKSTLLNLLTAAYHNYDGEIRFDNTELRKISTESLYETMTLIQQNVFIFNASIWDNITMFTDFPAEDVDRAIVQSGLSDLIAQRGKDYLCGENGNALSGGEKQRISIARALLRRSKLLLVDEATAALDPQTAYQVSDGILDLQSLTRIVVTHTLDERLLERYDCILALKNGAIIESGNFQELTQQKGYFYSLFTVSQ